ncbi:MAG: D-hexose-6-phosphate mutarotase [candidate division NC10 bacterium]|nr:D-hexose-6-phosphate mutarotase [candidate division NC10 bacterium]
MTDLSDLERRCGIPGAVRFEADPNGLIRALVSTPHAEAIAYLHGAHLTHYQPRGGRPVLFTSTQSRFQRGQPIRGGVPIVFPWFGPHGVDSSAPMHGFARVAEWRLEAAGRDPDGSVVLSFGLDSARATHPAWPHAYAARYSVRIGPRLEVALEVTNPSDQTVTYEEALHTYLAVEDVRVVEIRGLAGGTYVDNTDGMKRKTQESEPLRITGETVRVYLGTRATCVLEDPAAGRRLFVEKWGSDATVVWNPWVAKARAMPDFGDEEWPRMLCIETANVGEHTIQLPPGGRHVLGVGIRSESL